MRITKDTLIGDILKKDPDIADVLMQNGMHCVSCFAASGESLEQACLVHGIEVDDILEAIDEYYEAWEQNM